MPSSLFSNKSGNSILNAVNAARSIAGGNPQQAYNSMYQNDPTFRRFADSMRGKTPEQAFREYGLDYNQFRRLF